jgi:hypothetical protein
VEIDPNKIKSIMDWPTPKYVVDIISFMGLTGYYRRFIKGFPRLVSQSPPFRKRELDSFGQHNVRRVFTN